MRRILLVAALVFAVVAAPAAAAPYENPRLPVSKRVDDLLSRMNLQEKVGQMEQTERARVFDDPSPITNLKLGSILSGGGSTPTENTPPKRKANVKFMSQFGRLGNRAGYAVFKISIVFFGTWKSIWRWRSVSFSVESSRSSSSSFFPASSKGRMRSRAEMIWFTFARSSWRSSSATRASASL